MGKYSAEEIVNLFIEFNATPFIEDLNFLHVLLIAAFRNNLEYLESQTHEAAWSFAYTLDGLTTLGPRNINEMYAARFEQLNDLAIHHFDLLVEICKVSIRPIASDILWVKILGESILVSCRKLETIDS